MKSRALDGAAEDTGPIGPVAISALLFLLFASPLMRGGNRQVALIVLEACGLVFIAALCTGFTAPSLRLSLRSALLGLIVSSPAWLALVYLLPLPSGLWAASPGRAVYTELLSAAGIPVAGWMPLSLVPDATLVSLLAGIPLVAAFAAGLTLGLGQLRLVVAVLAGLAGLQVLVGMIQAMGGQNSSLYFGAASNRVFGTFANPNHFANYVALALAAYVWLGWMKLSKPRRHALGEAAALRRGIAVWTAGALFLLAGILISRSRGAMAGGLPAVVAAFTIALTVSSRTRPWRTTLMLVIGGLAIGVALIGLDVLLSRFELSALTKDASFRALLASTTLTGAAEFWPVGAGWGTYADVYPRFQPATVVGTADYAHHDYAQMLFEGGIFAVLLMAAFAWLAITRAVELVRAGIRNRRLRREEMAATICGLGLLGFLLHSLVEFNMHIPANAIVASLFAGVYLRPLPRGEEVPGD